MSRKFLGSNPIRVRWDFSALAESYPELGVFGSNGKAGTTAELHPLHACVFKSVALIT